MKRVLSLVLALSMVLGMFSFAFAGSNLKDIAGTDYEAAVDALVELGVVNGYTDGTFQPEKTVTRAEMAKLLVVAAGLEPAADVAKGATKFGDVNDDPSSQWATGYINVASEYGYIVGYPDGTFQPNETVTYAEAVTMALRVLGYRTVVESKGTWPTNYIAKAGDLKMLDEITYASYSDGAKRGNVAKLIWNMLRTRMWDVTGESEGNGLEYSKAQLMLDVKFPDYAYGTAEFESFSIKDGDVTIKLIGDKTKYAYEGADFFKYVKGTEVEVLINEKDTEILTLVPTDRDTIVEGTKTDLEDEDYENVPAGDYIYAMVDGDTVSGDATVLTVESAYVYEVKEQSSGIKINGGSTVKEKDFEKKVVIKDGERISYGDIEAGVVLSTVTVNGQEFYIVSEETVEGKLTKYVDDELTIGGDKYTADAKAEYVVDPEKDGKKAGIKLDSAKGKADYDDMKNEEVVAYVDFLNRVARIDFDGALGDDDSADDVHFYVIKSLVEKERAGVYSVTLENEDGEQEFNFEEGSTDGSSLYADDAKNTDNVGYLAAVWFNDDGEITKLDTIAKPSGDEAKITETNLNKEDVYTYGDSDEKEYYMVIKVVDAKYDEDKESIIASGETAGTLVDDETILVTLTFDDNDTKKVTDDYAVEYSEGTEDLKNIKAETVLVVYDASEKITTAKYVVRFKDSKNNDKIITGKLEESKLNKLGTEYTLTVDGEEYTMKKADDDSSKSITTYENGAILFKLEEDKDGDEFVKPFALMSIDEIRALAADDSSAKYVDEVKGSIVSFEGKKDVVINDTYRDENDDVKYVVIEVSAYAADKSGDVYDVKDKDVINSVSDVIEAEDITAADFVLADRVVETEDVVFIIRGLDEHEEAAAPAASPAPSATPTPSPDPVA